MNSTFVIENNCINADRLREPERVNGIEFLCYQENCKEIYLWSVTNSFIYVKYVDTWGFNY